MLPLAVSLEDLTINDDGEIEEYTYRVQYMGKVYYVSSEEAIEDMDMHDRQMFMSQEIFAEAFCAEAEENMETE